MVSCQRPVLVAAIVVVPGICDASLSTALAYVVSMTVGAVTSSSTQAVEPFFEVAIGGMAAMFEVVDMLDAHVASMDRP